MPYIAKADREKFQDFLNLVPEIKTKGELEYLIFSLMLAHMKNKEYRYSTLHDTVYAAIHCGDEFRRIHLDKREDAAKLTNGDIEIP